MHNHTHSDEPVSNYTQEEALALLKYMANHNREHTEELHELAHQLGGSAEALIHEACVDYQTANEKLEQALKILEET
ncbi:MAG: hypothetical protein Q4F31_08045 [Eubacteriales bacterium]|nr:hypothetical protein [Eubacteriales bacterium]